VHHGRADLLRARKVACKVVPVRLGYRTLPHRTAESARIGAAGQQIHVWNSSSRTAL